MLIIRYKSVLNKARKCPWAFHTVGLEIRGKFIEV
jgi:hypothetical protein